MIMPHFLTFATVCIRLNVFKLCFRLYEHWFKCIGQQLKFETDCSADERSTYLHNFIVEINFNVGFDLSLDLADVKDKPTVVSRLCKHNVIE